MITWRGHGLTYTESNALVLELAVDDPQAIEQMKDRHYEVMIVEVASDADGTDKKFLEQLRFAIDAFKEIQDIRAKLTREAFGR